MRQRERRKFPLFLFPRFLTGGNWRNMQGRKMNFLRSAPPSFPPKYFEVGERTLFHTATKESLSHTEWGPPLHTSLFTYSFFQPALKIVVLSGGEV